MASSNATTVSQSLWVWDLHVSTGCPAGGLARLQSVSQACSSSEAQLLSQTLLVAESSLALCSSRTEVTFLLAVTEGCLEAPRHPRRLSPSAGWQFVRWDHWEASP